MESKPCLNGLSERAGKSSLVKSIRSMLTNWFKSSKTQVKTIKNYFLCLLRKLILSFATLLIFMKSQRIRLIQSFWWKRMKYLNALPNFMHQRWKRFWSRKIKVKRTQKIDHKEKVESKSKKLRLLNLQKRNLDKQCLRKRRQNFTIQASLHRQRKKNIWKIRLKKGR